jgi:UDP-N-acetylmuramoyl-L-alanyl-D-glutamate--2,6-diaminopimelate ligase
MKLEKLIKNTATLSISGRTSVEVTGVVSDSRAVRPGSLFVAISGQHADGGRYAGEAVEKGAVAVAAEGEVRIPRTAAFVKIPDARSALADLSAAFYGNPSAQMKMVGITGTNGKTTVAHLVADVLEGTGCSAGLLGTVEYRIGQRIIPASRTTPEPPVLQSLLRKMKDADCRAVVMEVSSHALVQQRVRGIDYDIAVFTNLSRDHLDYHRSREEYFRAKSILFENMGKGRKRGHAVLNADDPCGRRLLERNDIGARKCSFGIDADADVSAEDIQLTNEGTSYTLKSPWGEARVRSRMLGRFNVYNGLAAFAVCGILGVGVEDIAGVIAGTRRVPGRLEEVENESGFKVFVDYAHTDDALAHVLKTLREITPRRLIVVFGCGGDRDRTKRPAMAQVAGNLADRCILTSDNPRTEDPGSILEEVKSGFESAASYEIVEDREEAIRHAIESAGKGDVVLIAGKGHETFQEFANTTVPFDDRLVAEKYL